MADRCDECWHVLDLHERGGCAWPGCRCGQPEETLRYPTWGVVPTKGRPDDLAALVKSLTGQLTGLVIVDNNDDPMPMDADIWTLALAGGCHIVSVHMPGYPPNLSALLNAGYDQAAELVGTDGPWNVCYFNDDVEVPDGWAVNLEAALRLGEAVAAYVDRLSRSSAVLSRSAPSNFNETMTCWACMLRGELNIRWDERFRWWYGDNDLDLRCRLDYGGTVAVPGVMPAHKHPSEATFRDPVLSALAHEDGRLFTAKWSGRV